MADDKDVMAFEEEAQEFTSPGKVEPTLNCVRVEVLVQITLLGSHLQHWVRTTMLWRRTLATS